MLTDQHFFRSERSVSDARGQAPSQVSAEFMGTYDAQAHEIVDAITAAVFNAEAGLNWLRAEPPDLEKARQALNSIVGDGKRAAGIVVRLRALMKEVPTADEALTLQVQGSQGCLGAKTPIDENSSALAGSTNAHMDRDSSTRYVTNQRRGKGGL